MNSQQTLAANVLRTVVRPTLEAIGYGGQAAEELVLGTGIQESGLTHRRQIGGGPALGLWQMEPATFRDLWKNYILPREKLRVSMLKFSHSEHPSHASLETDDRFACAMCRLHYLRVRSPLPGAGAIVEQAEYWKRYYNTYLGKGTAAQYLKKWQQYVTTDTWS